MESKVIDVRAQQLVKAWAFINPIGSIKSSFNIVSVTLSGTGSYIIYSPAITSDSVIVVSACRSSENPISFPAEQLDGRSTGACQICTTNANGLPINGGFQMIVV